MDMKKILMNFSGEYQGRISKRLQKDGTINVYGDLLNNGTVIKRHCFRRKINADSQYNMEIVERQALNRLERSIPSAKQEHQAFARSAEGNENEIDALLSKFLEDGYTFHTVAAVGKKKSWNENTHKAVYTYCLNHGYAEFLLSIERPEDCKAARADYREALIQKTMANGRSKKQRQQVEQTVDQMLARMNILTEELRKHLPALPDFPFFDENHRTIAIPEEQVKALPEEMNQKFRKMLEEFISREPRMVLAGTLMFDGGLRTAEAAGVRKEEFNFSEIGYSLLTVRWQESNGQRIERLKTDNAYRYVLLSYWATQMVKKCLETLGSTWREDLLVPAKKLSRWLKEKLCECQEDFMAYAERVEAQRPDLNENGTPVRDVAAYVLRRNAASRWMNHDGLTQGEVDYMLGHKKAKKKKDMYLLNELDQRSICHRLERYVYSPESTLNPEYSPIELTGLERKKRFCDFAKYTFVNTADVPVVLHIDTEASNPDEAIVLSTPQNAVTGKVLCRSIKFKPSERNVFVRNKKNGGI